jgi:Arc/MetJ-type ribon-helix-helix transcriptional regulator
MRNLSVETEREIERRLARGKYGSPDELLCDAFRALDDAQGAAQAWLEKELLEGLEGDDVEMNASEWESIARESEHIIETKRSK